MRRPGDLRGPSAAARHPRTVAQGTFLNDATGAYLSVVARSGSGLGSAITWLYADTRDWRFAVPLTGLLGAVAAALAVGAVAGLYPAVRASRLAPAEAVRSE